MPNQVHSISPKLAAIFANKEAFAFNLLVAFLDSYGMEAMTWSPETIEMEIADDFNVDISAANFDRLLTARHIMAGNDFYVSPVDFARGCVSLSGHPYWADTMILPDSEDVAWGITEAMLIMPPDPSNESIFSPEILGLIGGILDEEGILTPPDVLKIADRANDVMNRVSYEFSDDPEMFAAIQGVESDRTDAVNHFVRSRLQALLNQLQELPLKTGKTEFVKQVLAKLPASDKPVALR
jgi:hypothetical protein